MFINDPETAVQFLATVSTETSFHHRPTDRPSVDEILEYTIKEEIMNTSKRGAYCG